MVLPLEAFVLTDLLKTELIHPQLAKQQLPKKFYFSPSSPPLFREFTNFKISEEKNKPQRKKQKRTPYQLLVPLN
jgi:hypothetical protein